TGQAARLGGFSGSWTQTLFRVGDVDITDPTGTGAPLGFPDLALWQRTRILTGMMPIDLNAIGLAIGLEPVVPTATWVRSAFVSSSHGGLSGRVSDSIAPAIARLDGWDRVEAGASGPLSGRVGGAFSAAWARDSQFDRGAPSALRAETGSVSVNLVFTPTSDNQVRTLGWFGRSAYPFSLRAPFGAPSSTTTDTSGHVQLAWSHGSPGAVQWRTFAGYTDRARKMDTLGPTAVFERLTDGPPLAAASVGATNVGQWTAGARLVPALRGQRHSLEGGVEIGGARERLSNGWSGAVGELVDGMPARVWRVVQPGGQDIRRESSVSVFASDRIELGPRANLDLGLRFDNVSGSAEGAAGDIGWHTWLPRATVRWKVSARSTAIVGISRSAYRLPLDFLAVGDPAAPVADV